MRHVDQIRARYTSAKSHPALPEHKSLATPASDVPAEQTRAVWDTALPIWQSAPSVLVVQLTATSAVAPQLQQEPL